jgi:anthranilate synthase component 1
MFYLDFECLATVELLRLIGAAEVHASLQGRLPPCRLPAHCSAQIPAEGHPGQDLLADLKNAEHIHAGRLGRNDLGRICRYGSVQVREKMVVERYSHVIHLVSHVEGELRPEYDAFDLLRATFPAGTVSGAPKIRAMQIIHDLEPEGRGAYAGAVGYFSYDGNMDTCIAIRTLVMQGQTVVLQAGAGIVADSIPENEYQETLNKLGALAVAIEMAEEKI